MKYRTGLVTMGAPSILLLVSIITALFPLSIETVSVAHAQTGSSGGLAPPALNVTSTGANEVELRWMPVSGAFRYELWTWWDDAIGWHQVDDGDLTDTTFSHSGLSAGTTYYNQARAVGASGETGSWSERIFATTEASQSSLAPPALTAEPGEGLIELSWTPVSGASSYELWTWTSAEDWQRLDDST